MSGLPFLFQQLEGVRRLKKKKTTPGSFRNPGALFKTTFHIPTSSKMQQKLAKQKGGTSPSDITCLPFIPGSPGYPQDPNSHFVSDLFPGGVRMTYQVSKSFRLGTIGPFSRSLNFYGDGSLYIIDHSLKEGEEKGRLYFTRVVSVFVFEYLGRMKKTRRVTIRSKWKTIDFFIPNSKQDPFLAQPGRSLTFIQSCF